VVRPSISQTRGHHKREKGEKKSASKKLLLVKRKLAPPEMARDKEQEKKSALGHFFWAGRIWKQAQSRCKPKDHDSTKRLQD